MEKNMGANLVLAIEKKKTEKGMMLFAAVNGC
jgi:hypothetical protein